MLRGNCKSGTGYIIMWFSGSMRSSNYPFRLDNLWCPKGVTVIFSKITRWHVAKYHVRANSVKSTETQREKFSTIVESKAIVQRGERRVALRTNHRLPRAKRERWKTVFERAWLANGSHGTRGPDFCPMIEQRNGGTDKPRGVGRASFERGRGRTFAHALMTNRRQARRTETSTCVVQSPPGIPSVAGLHCSFASFQRATAFDSDVCLNSALIDLKLLRVWMYEKKYEENASRFRETKLHNSE